MVYEDEKEMEKVIGRLDENGFIRHQEQELDAFVREVKGILRKLKQA
jgi:hypothetical protein